MLFYSQFSCAIARFLFSNISVSFCLAFSMYFLSSEDGLNWLPMSIGSTRYSPDSVRTRDRTTYSQFLEHCSNSSSRPRWYNNYIFWHSLQFVSGCCIIDICWNLYHFTTKFNFFWWSIILAFDGNFGWALFRFKFESPASHFVRQSIPQLF